MLRRGIQLHQALTSLSGWNADHVVTPPSRRVRFVRWLAALATLLMAYQAYAWLVVPVIEPSPRMTQRADAVEMLPAADAHPELAQLFPDGAWERGRPMVLTTQWGRLLFREYKTGSDGRLELIPCTIVFHVPTQGKDSAPPRAVVLQAPDKAVLNFAGPLNVALAEFTKLKGARLEGEVKIWSRETQPGANDALSIVTRNVQILPQQIWTAHEVAFSYGGSHGTGRDLSITVSPSSGDRMPAAKEALVKDLESLELTHLDKLTVNIPHDGLLSDMLPGASDRPPSAAATPSAAAPDAPATVTCQGPFRFNFQQAVASLEDDVQIIRENAAGPSDQLSCDQVLVYFESPSGGVQSEAPAADRKSPSPPVVRKLAVRKVEARGRPADLRAASLAVTASAQQLSYDFRSRRILLVDEQNALLTYQQHRAEAPRLEYELHAEPRRLGHLWATGPGMYQGQFENESAQTRPLTARWCGVLELQPQEGLHVLSIVDGADCTWDSMGKFAADQLYLWMAEVPVPDAAPAADQGQQATLEAPTLATPASATESPVPSASTRYEIRPVKMLAQGNVFADAPQFQGKTPRLEIWFDHPEGASAAAAEATNTDSPPPAADPAAPAAEPPRSAAPDEKISLTGDWMRLRLRMVPKRPKVNEATVVGNVRLSQVALPAPESPLLITGEMLQLRNDLLDRASVDVTGTPARVHAQGMLLEGSNLHVSQRENRMWAEGPGRMKLPTQGQSGMPAAFSIAPSAPPPAVSPAAAQEDGAPSSTPIWITWQGGMDFDGQLIRFLRQVEVRGIHTAKNGDRQHLLAVGDQLHAGLNRYVAFDQAKTSSNLDVAELRFIGDVFTENQTFNVEDVLTSRDRVKTLDMTLDRRSGRFHAAGPGWITSTRYDSAQVTRNLPGTSAAPAGAGAVAPARGNRLVYLRVDYRNEIEGNIDKREAVFQHYVRTIYCPVESWDQAPDPDQPGGLSPQGIVMTCQRLFVAETGDGPQRGVELSAVGDTLVEGAKFTAWAQRFSYVQVKDLLIMDGADQPARVRLQRRPGERPTEFSARQFKYWISTGEHEEFGVTQLDFTTIGSPKIPPARIR